MKRDADQILFPGRDRHAIPSMDGALSPNDDLDRAVPFGPALVGADAVALGLQGEIYVTAGNDLLRLGPTGTAEVIATFDSPAGGPAGGLAGGLTVHPDGRILVCVAGQGLVGVDPSGKRTVLSGADGTPLTGLTDVTVAPDGAIFAVQGSALNTPDRFLHDLMQRNSVGSLIACDGDLGGARILADDLAYGAGLCTGTDGLDILVTQAWSHRLTAYPRNGGVARVLIGNMPGYPGRISQAKGGGYWMCLFAMRTHLTELVLREDPFREKMMAQVAPEYWIGPALRTTGSYYEPLQAGNVKKLGVQKPWAPPRSYGLIVKIDETGEIVNSIHSRVGGQWHGITCAVEMADGLVAVSKGQGQVLRLPREALK